jgi:hypothetical protein
MNGHVNLVIVNYVREWPYPKTSNLYTHFDDYRAVSVVCDECLSKPITHAVEVKDGEVLYYPVTNLTRYRTVLDSYLPFCRGIKVTPRTIEVVLVELRKAGHEGNERAGAFLSDWLIQRLMRFALRDSYAEEVIGIILRRMYHEPQSIEDAMRLLSTVVDFDSDLASAPAN